MGSPLLHQPIRRSRELSSKAPWGVTWENSLSFSRDTSKNQPVGGGERRVNSGEPWGPPTYATYPPHVVPYPGDCENSERLDTTSYPPGTPVEEIYSFSYLVRVPNVGWELATQVVGIWWTLKSNLWITRNQLPGFHPA